MRAEGYGGRGARYYIHKDWPVFGIMLTDPYTPTRGWGKPKHIPTPFGLLGYNGDRVIMCGNCGKQQFPQITGKTACHCDFEAATEVPSDAT